MRREICSDELEFFYKATGEAIWHLQYVEDALCKYYVVVCIHFGCDGVNRENAEAVCAKVGRKTLGQLIGFLERTGRAPDAMLSDLKDFNTLRKWVVHNSMRENGSDLYTDEGREAFAKKLLIFGEMARSIHNGISDSLMHLVTAAGHATEDQIMRRAISEIAILKGNA